METSRLGGCRQTLDVERVRPQTTRRQSVTEIRSHGFDSRLTSPYTVPLTQVLPVIDLRVAFLDERSRAGLAGERRHAVCLRVAFNAGDRIDQFSCRTGV